VSALDFNSVIQFVM